MESGRGDAGRRSAGSRREHRLDDLFVPGAAAQVPGKPILDLGAGRLRDSVEQGLRRDELARDAEPALRRATVEERLLERAQPSVDRQPLDGRHLCSVGLHAEHQARVDAAPVDEHRARTALPDEAALLGAGQGEILTEDIEQGVVRLDLDRAVAAVDRDLDSMGRRHCGTVPPASRSIAVLMARRPRTWSIARRYSGLARMDRADGLASANRASRRRALVMSGTFGSARSPLSSATRTGRGPSCHRPTG